MNIYLLIYLLGVLVLFGMCYYRLHKGNDVSFETLGAIFLLSLLSWFGAFILFMSYVLHESEGSNKIYDDELKKKAKRQKPFKL